MNRYKTMANIFYSGSDKHSKALDAGTLLDNRLSNVYRSSGASEIQFDAGAFNAYFSYEKLVLLPEYDIKSALWSHYLNSN